MNSLWLLTVDIESIYLLHCSILLPSQETGKYSSSCFINLDELLLVLVKQNTCSQIGMNRIMNYFPSNHVLLTVTHVNARSVGNKWSKSGMTALFTNTEIMLVKEKCCPSKKLHSELSVDDNLLQHFNRSHNRGMGCIVYVNNPTNAIELEHSILSTIPDS